MSPGGRVLSALLVASTLAGVALAASTGTQARRAYLVKDIVPGRRASIPADLTAANGLLFFTAWDPKHGRELWKTDGTATGTVLVKDIDPGADDAFGEEEPAITMANAAGTVFFVANDGKHGFELWKSDGTRSGTLLVKDIQPGPRGSRPYNLTAAAKLLFFELYGRQLWKSDGTAAGTALVKTFRVEFALNYSPPSPWTDVDGALFFAADDGIHGSELWKTDGTAAGTVLVKDIRLGREGSGPEQLTNVSGTLFFGAPSAAHRLSKRLWRSDGSESGTTLVKDVGVAELVALDRTAFFLGGDRAQGGLWKSDGTEKSTVLVKHRRPRSQFGFLAKAQEAVFFAAYDPGTGFRLWRSDGTSQGTFRVPAGTWRSIYALTGANGRIFFSAQDKQHGWELWTSDGTARGTALVKEIRPGPKSSHPYELTDVNGTLFFRANDGRHGRELWAVPAGA